MRSGGRGVVGSSHVSVPFPTLSETLRTSRVAREVLLDAILFNCNGVILEDRSATCLGLRAVVAKRCKGRRREDILAALEDNI